jgi:hypothetical protein
MPPPGDDCLTITSDSESELLSDWRFTANHFVLTPSPLSLPTRIFLQLNPCSHSPNVTSSLTKRWAYLLWLCLAFRQVYVSHIQNAIENYSFWTTHKYSVSTGFTEQIMPNLHILCYNGSLVTWTVVSLTTAKFRPLTFSMSGFAFSYTANTFILMILYEFCLNNFVISSYTWWRLKTVCKSRTSVHLGNFPTVRRTLFCMRCNFEKYVTAAGSQAGQS